MNSIEDLKWDIKDMNRHIEAASRQLGPAKRIILQLEDSMRETTERLKEAQKILGKAKDLA